MGGEGRVTFLRGGWGKIAAAASLSFAAAAWKPKLIINIGTCGGFRGRVEKGDWIVVRRAVVYDIVEAMGDSDDAVEAMSTSFDLGWLPESLPQPARIATIASGDREIQPLELDRLHEKYGAVVGDWESGSIAWVSTQLGVRCLILRGVSDLVGRDGGEAYEDGGETFLQGVEQVFRSILPNLEDWIRIAQPT